MKWIADAVVLDRHRRRRRRTNKLPILLFNLLEHYHFIVVNGISKLNFHLNLTVFPPSFTGDWSARGCCYNKWGIKVYKANFLFALRVIPVESQQKRDQFEENPRLEGRQSADRTFLIGISFQNTKLIANKCIEPLAMTTENWICEYKMRCWIEYRV